MSEHSKEPWRVISIDGWDGVGTVPDERGFADDICKLVYNNPSNARRIVACINACKGISTENLESRGVIAIGETYIRPTFRIEEDV